MVYKVESLYAGLQDVEVFLTELRADPFSEFTCLKSGGLLPMNSVHCYLYTN